MTRSTNTQFAVAVHVLTYLAGAGAGRVVTSDELAGSIRVNPVHLRKVLGPLREAGVVVSVPGARGGWRLLAEPARLTLADVWRLVQGEEQAFGMHAPDPECETGRGVGSALAEVDRAVSGAIADTLERYSIQSLCAGLMAPAVSG